MFFSMLKRCTAFSVSTVLLASIAANAAGASPRAAARPAAQTVRINASTPGNEQVYIEGGTLAANYDGNLADLVGVPIACTTTPGEYRDCASESSLPAKFKTNPQILYAAVGTGGAQLDFVSQQSGLAGKTASTVPEFADSRAAYSNTAPIGFTVPWAGTAAEPTGPAEDTLHAAAGDAPIPLGPAESQAYVPNGFTVYADSLAAYNGGGDLTGGGFNANRGPAIVAPVIATGISIIFNTTNLTVPPGGLDLTQNDLCGILTGAFTNWNQTSSNPGNQPITIIHRSDGSGSTFLVAYDLSEMCSGFNPFKGTGAPVAANYWGQINNAKTQGVGTDSNTYGTAGPNGIYNNLPLDSGAPEVVWPAGSVGASKTSGVIAAVAATNGGVGYVSPSNTLGANTQEAYVENYQGNYEQATATTVAASFEGTTVAAASPPGYPSQTKTTPYLYFAFPQASGGDALVGYSYGYFYTCYPTRLTDQVTGFEDLFAYAEKEPATDSVVAAFWNLNALGTNEQKALKTALGLIQKKAVTKAKDYYSPVNGAELKYTCTDN